MGPRPGGGVETISQLQDKVFHRSGSLEALLMGLSGGRIPMFSDPAFYAAFRSTVIPIENLSFDSHLAACLL